MRIFLILLFLVTAGLVLLRFLRKEDLFGNLSYPNSETSKPDPTERDEK